MNLEHHIITIICEKYKVTRYELTTKATPRDVQRIAIARQTAAFFLRGRGWLTMTEIARSVGYNHKANVAQAIKTVERTALGDKSVQADLAEIDELLFCK